MDRAQLQAWVEAYERAWRTAGVAPLRDLFAEDATYQAAPFDDPIAGLPAIEVFWEAEREGPDEVFTMTSEIVAVEGRVGVVRLEVTYGDPVTDRFRDLWIVETDDDGRCVAFEEWPFFPEHGRVPSPAPA
jgi:hypothetical protein